MPSRPGHDLEDSLKVYCRMCASWGVTATTDRADGKDLEALFGPVIYERGPLWALENGYLVDLRGIQVSTSINRDGVYTRMGGPCRGRAGAPGQQAGAQ